MDLLYLFARIIFVCEVWTMRTRICATTCVRASSVLSAALPTQPWAWFGGLAVGMHGSWHAWLLASQLACMGSATRSAVRDVDMRDAGVRAMVGVARPVQVGGFKVKHGQRCTESQAQAPVQTHMLEISVQRICLCDCGVKRMLLCGGGGGGLSFSRAVWTHGS